MIKKIFILFSAFAFTLAYAQDTAFIQFNKLQFNKNDTVHFDCNYLTYKNQNVHYATLNVWIENIETHQFWKFRYPIINGETKGNLVINASLPDGKYAFNFLVQRRFFQLEGQITNYQTSQKEINYFIVTKEGNAYLNTFTPNADGTFKLNGHLFEDTVSFIFSPTNKNEENRLMVNVKSPLDSFFVADAAVTQIIQIGSNKNIVSNKKITTNNYQFNYTDFYRQTTLPNVSVEGKVKTKIEKFDELYSTGLFKSGDAKIFDGIESDQITRYKSFIEFVKGKVPGLHIDDLGNNTYFLLWRGVSDFHTINRKPRPADSNVDIFIDELRQNLEYFDWYSVNTQDIAMIKTYPPPAYLSPGGKGAIVVYTKRGDYGIETKTKGNYEFKIFGYSKPEIVWRK